MNSVPAMPRRRTSWQLRGHLSGALWKALQRAAFHDRARICRWSERHAAVRCSGHRPVRTRSWSVSGASHPRRATARFQTRRRPRPPKSPRRFVARVKTGPRIRSRTPTSPRSPSANVRSRTPWRTTETRVMSGVNPVLGAGRSHSVSHPPGPPLVVQQLDLMELGPRQRDPNCRVGRVLSITSTGSIRIFAAPSAWRTWK